MSASPMMAPTPMHMPACPTTEKMHDAICDVPSISSDFDGSSSRATE